MREINIEEFNKLIEAQKDNLEIIDVREPDEFEIIKIKNSKLIPMQSAAARQTEIDWKKTVVFVCRTGARSRYVARGLPGREILNLAGGLKACYNNRKCYSQLEIDLGKLDGYF